MSRGSKTAIANVSAIANLPAPGSTITQTQALEIAKKVGTQLFREAKAAQKIKKDEMAEKVGGQINRIDESVLDQGRTFMTRLALISNSKRGQYQSGSSTIDGAIKKLAGIVGELEAAMLTDRAVGLFQDVNEHDYEGRNYGRQALTINEAVGTKAKAAAEQVLSQYKIVEEPPLPKNGRKQKNVTPEVEEIVDAEDVAEEAISELEEEVDREDESEARS